ncbi:MAG: MotA/TolQ/ExbB proton channel family protein [Spirochaetota bacterium]|nr:MotA/TolQ/ExbB proton channel family protein [Spirochaetota bacterium]
MVVPIIICSVVSMAIIIERLIFYRRIKYNYRHILNKILNLVGSGKIREAKDLCNTYKGPIMIIICNYLDYCFSDHNKERIIRDLSQNAVTVIEKNIGIISTIATISPMLGLFGTVTGMMKSFSGLSKVGPVAQELLAHGIAEALITTALSLLVAIPSWIFYNYMVGRVDGYIKEVDYIANSLMLLND